MNEAKKVVVVGSSNTDMVVQTERLPDPGETVLGGDLVIAPGGKGANQAVAAARLGGEVAFIARVGKDVFGEEALKNFAREGLNIRFVIQDESAPSGVALIVVGPGGENIITVAPGANSRLTPQNVLNARSAFEEASVLLLQLETPLDTVQKAAELAHETQTKVILNPAPAPSNRLPQEVISLVDIITPNESEATLLTGEDEPEAAARKLLELGVETVIITLGAKGALAAVTTGSMQHVPGFTVKAVDATAAGDAFNGALAVALADGRELTKAIRFAHAVAALSVTKLGAQPSLPPIEEVERFLTGA